VNHPLSKHPTNALVLTSPIVRLVWRSALLTMLVAVAIALAAPAARAQPASAFPPEKPPFPNITLPARAQGQQALSQLGSRLPEVAAWYGMSVPQFSNMIRFDRTAWLDQRGRVFFEEEVELPTDTTEAAAQTDPLSPDLEPLDQTFRLHSRPGAKRTIYLNFVGATLTGTAWNSSSKPTITAEPFDLDGVPYSFSSAELQRIQYIWKRVAEDYSAFDVNVTTEPPPADRLTRSSSSDDVYGTTVLITRRTFYNCSCGGVAYLTAFNDVGDYYKPALVFYNALGSGNEKYVADAISHEAGHNVGLGHDGTSSSGYYTGHGSGATGWAPIMGVGYYKQLVQWSKGEYAGANNTQDDYVVMQNTGLPIRADDHGNGIASATPLAGSTTSGVTTFGGSGVVERPSDVDFFSFVAGTGSVTVNVSPAPRAPKLDILVTLRNSAGAVLASANPTESLPASLAANLTADLLRQHRRGRQGRSADHGLHRLRQHRPVHRHGHHAGDRVAAADGDAVGNADLRHRAAGCELQRRRLNRQRRHDRCVCMEFRRRRQPDRRHDRAAHLLDRRNVHGDADGHRQRRADRQQVGGNQRPTADHDLRTDGEQGGKRRGHCLEQPGRHQLRCRLRRVLRFRHQRDTDRSACDGVDVRRLVRRLFRDRQLHGQHDRRPSGHRNLQRGQLLLGRQQGRTCNRYGQQHTDRHQLRHRLQRRLRAWHDSDPDRDTSDWLQLRRLVRCLFRRRHLHRQHDRRSYGHRDVQCSELRPDRKQVRVGLRHGHQQPDRRYLRHGLHGELRLRDNGEPDRHPGRRR